MKRVFYDKYLRFVYVQALTMDRVVMDQSGNCRKRITVQAVEELPGNLCISETIAMNEVSLVGDKLDLVEQILECLGREQNLGLTKVH
jgi:hypothetical protein